MFCPFLPALRMSPGCRLSTENHAGNHRVGILLGRRETGADGEIRRYGGGAVRLGGQSADAERAGLREDQIEPEILRNYKEVPREGRGPGGHPLTGPIAIEGAEPGDVLEVRIKEIRLRADYAFNSTAGFWPTRFRSGKTKIIPLDRERMIGHFAPGIDIPLRPFFGSMGVAPPEADGQDQQRASGNSRRQSR